MNLGLPTLAYGIAACFLIKHKEMIKTAKGNVDIYFLIPEDKDAMYWATEMVVPMEQQEIKYEN